MPPHFFFDFHLRITAPKNTHQPLPLRLHLLPLRLALTQNRHRPASPNHPILTLPTIPKRRANDNAEIPASAHVQVAQHAAVQPARALVLDLREELAGALFRRAGHGAWRERGGEDGQAGGLGRESAADDGDELVDGGVFFDGHELRDVDFCDAVRGVLLAGCEGWFFYSFFLGEGEERTLRRR